ncbi:right-handed parallel beta-helix repeat-containing protein [Candidatus Poribacteria bacterium]|nr:right-handed parallel beta-helix repeat-containing protein [Candidatus Poribacteria bacterium]
MIKAIAWLISIMSILILIGCAYSPSGEPQSSHPSEGEEVQTKSGRLQKDEIWSGEVWISGELVIPREVSVTVMPGTLVRFKSDGGRPGKIVVEGSFYAQGNPDRPIIFNSLSSSGGWDGIFFTKQSMGSALRSCIIQNHRQIYVNTDAVRINDCVINGAEEAGIVVDGVSPRLTNISVSQSSTGIYCLNGASPEISQSSITMNGYGIVCESGASPIISNSVIANNRMHGVVCYSGSSPKLVSNNIVHNGGWAVYGGGRLIDNFIMGNNRRPPDEVETETGPTGKQYQQVEEISGMRTSPIPYAGIRRGEM